MAPMANWVLVQMLRVLTLVPLCLQAKPLIQQCFHGNIPLFPAQGQMLTPSVLPITHQMLHGCTHKRRYVCRFNAALIITLSLLCTIKDMPLRAPMGSSAQPAFSHPPFRRSLSLSQQESAFIPHQLVAGTKSYRTHKLLRATTSLQHPSPTESAGAPMTLQHPSTAESAGASVSAFKQFSSPDRSCLSQPIPPPPMHADIRPPNLVCDRGEVKFDSLSPNDLLTVYCQLSALTCPVLKLE